MNSNKFRPIVSRLRKLTLEAKSKLRFKNYVFLPRKYSKWTMPIPRVLKIPQISQDARRYTMSAGTPGQGAGRGGGAGGSVKEGGGGLGKYAAAQEEGYFYKKSKEQIKKLKKTLKLDESADEGSKNPQ